MPQRHAPPANVGLAGCRNPRGFHLQRTDAIGEAALAVARRLALTVARPRRLRRIWLARQHRFDRRVGAFEGYRQPRDLGRDVVDPPPIPEAGKFFFRSWRTPCGWSLGNMRNTR